MGKNKKEETATENIIKEKRQIEQKEQKKEVVRKLTVVVENYTKIYFSTSYKWKWDEEEITGKVGNMDMYMRQFRILKVYNKVTNELVATYEGYFTTIVEVLH